MSVFILSTDDIKTVMTCLIWEDRSSVYYLTGSICYVVYSLLLEFQVSSSNVWMTEVALLASGLFTINCKIRFLKCTLVLLCSRKMLMFDASKLDSDFLGQPLRFSIIWPSSPFFSSHIHHQLSPILCQLSDSVPQFTSLIPIPSATLISIPIDSGHTHSCFSPNLKLFPMSKAQFLLMLLKN